MGYNTEFTGTLFFTKPLTIQDMVYLRDNILNEDCRDHPEWNCPELTYIDLEFNSNYTGLEWNGAEKTYDLERKVNIVIAEMRKLDPDYGLKGQLMAQGESLGDVWVLKIDEQGNALRDDRKIDGRIVKCPHCEEKFVLNEE